MSVPDDCAESESEEEEDDDEEEDEEEEEEDNECFDFRLRFFERPFVVSSSSCLDDDDLFLDFEEEDLRCFLDDFFECFRLR